MQGAMNNMQQRVYRPPNVAGWEGGMSWLNTNTVQGRFDLVTRVQYLKYSNYYAGDGRRRRSTTPGRDAATCRRFDRAYALGQPAVALRAAHEAGDASAYAATPRRRRTAAPAPAAASTPCRR